jgi:hypothetical protein
MSASSVKGRELVPVTRTVEGDVQLVRNIIAARIQRGEVVQVHRSVSLPGGRVSAHMTLMEPRQRLLVRLRRRVLEVVWPAGERSLVRVFRVFAYAVGMLLGAAIGYAVYEIVVSVVWVVRVTHRYWPALLVLAIVIAVAGGKKTVQAIAHLCDKCGGSGVL